MAGRGPVRWDHRYGRGPGHPQTLKSQLAEGGRLVIPTGPRYTQTLYKVTRKGDHFIEEDITGCVFVPLVGDFGWKEE